MYKRLLTSIFALFAFTQFAIAEEDFLTPDQAFAVTAVAVSPETVRVTWEIADGYYLYQSKFKFGSDDVGVALGNESLPSSITKDDPIFGKVEIYRNKVSIDVPIESFPANLDSFNLKTRSQGCADKGICYPPQTRSLLVAVSPSADKPRAIKASATQKAPAGGSGFDPLAELSALGSSLGLNAMEDDILDPEQAFVVRADSPSGDWLNVNWTIAEGTYLYQDKVRVSIEGNGVALGQYSWPTPDIKKDSIKPDGTIGDVPVYHNAIDLEIPLIRTNTDATELTVKLGYQGCADRGICYPPQSKTFKVALPASAGAKAQTAAAPMAEPAADVVVNEQDQLLTDLQSASPLFALALSLGFGVLVAFTACMYPMIPILTSLIMGQGDKITPLRSFNLSLAYTQGIAITFGVLGAVMAVVGKELGIQSSLQTPWVLIPSAILFVGLALSMFGFYQIQMPSAIQSRLNDLSNNQKGGNLIGVVLMGVLSALIVGPCGGPVLLAVLAFAAQSQDWSLGFIYLWVFGTGMGLPLLLMGSGGGALLPRAGTWMDTVKATGGVIMLALAVSFLERLSPTYIATEVIMLMWGALLIVTAIYMGALKAQSDDTTGWAKLFKGLGLFILLYGAAFVIGVAAGSKDTMQPLKGVISVHGGATEEHAAFTRIKTLDELNQAVKQASAEGKSVMLDFYADWCTYCKTMEQEIFPDPKVKAALSNFVLLQADITRMDDDDKALTEHLNMPAPPALYFWNSKGEERRDLRLIGNLTAEQLVKRISQVN
ncbi:MAG: protein-disulfide reductase DsbD [Sedimenticolaceae bacterium]|jgi:thiol:disulfide interchange protein DsbD